MKKLLLCLTATIAVFTAYSQEPLKGFTFEKFKQGEIVKKGSKSSALLNYDEIGQKMVFAKNDECFYLGDIASIIYINIDGRTFVPVNNSEIFYEEIDLGGGNRLYVQSISEIENKGSGGAYGSASQTTATDRVTQISEARGQVASDGRTVASRSLGNPDIQNLKIANSAPLIEKTLFYLKVNGEFKPIFTKANLISALGHKNEINEFIKQNKIDFKKQEDVKKAVGFAYSL